MLLSAAVLFGQDSARTATALEPYHIKSDALGEAISVYRQNNPECGDKDAVNGLNNFYHVRDSVKWSGMCMTLGRETFITYANIRMDMKQATFSEDRFVWLMYTARHSDYVFLRDNLIAKFGEATKKTTKGLQNRMGAHFTGEVLLWDNGVSSIHLEEYSGNLDTSSLVFALDEYLKHQDDLQKTSPKKPSPDM